jgi:L-amino acid N-acyltransferase
MVEIRPATEADLPTILAIYNDAIENSSAIWVDHVSTLEDRQAWFEMRRRQGYPILVAAENGEVLGYGSFGDFRAFEGFRGTVEHSLYIGPNARRRGVGKALLVALMEAARDIGKDVMVAAIDSENKASIALHEAFGFRTTGKLDKVGRKFGRLLDLVFMQIELN